MRRTSLALLLTLLTITVAASEAEVRRGKLLFDQPWRVPAGQDPVGPLLNARACADCHPSGDSGVPAGPALVLRTGGDAVLGRQIQPIAVAGIDAEMVPAPRWWSLDQADGPMAAPYWELDGLRLAARLAPSLRGAGLLALIPAGLLRQVADPEDRDSDGISGRLGQGRFGTKAQHASLAAQIEEALAVDMGLATSAHPSPAGDCTEAQLACVAAAGGGAPVSQESIGRLVAYVAALRPRPAEASMAPGDGERLFADLGCAACHAGPYLIASDAAVTGRPSEIIAPFSDLLLHDLGAGLADPFPSAHAEAGEWRTTPLWGLRLRQAYLHDGRADSLATAILWHDGEAAASQARFQALAEAEQATLLAFLGTL